jgi:hypothetical protein
MQRIVHISSVVLLLICCKISTSPENACLRPSLHHQTYKIIPDSIGNTVATRFIPPEGYTLDMPDSNSFGCYLQQLPLKSPDQPVHYYNNSTKPSSGVYCAVIDMSLGNRDLQQCADAVIRLRGEFLYSRNQFAAIHFNFVSDGKPRYFTEFAAGDYSYTNFMKYLDYIFTYANTRSLFDEMVAIPNPEDMQIGDVFIQKRNPYGHAVIVVNMASNTRTREKIYMLAQSYMPAQDIQILINPVDPELSPWYRLSSGTVRTPEWTFITSDLHRFVN